MTFRVNDAHHRRDRGQLQRQHPQRLLKALLLVNEQLEAELEVLYAAVTTYGPFERRRNVLHYELSVHFRSEPEPSPAAPMRAIKYRVPRPSRSGS